MTINDVNESDKSRDVKNFLDPGNSFLEFQEFES